MKMNDIFPSKYLKADDLNGREVTVKISDCRMEEIGQGSNKEEKPIVYFDGKEKGVVLNKTNFSAIADAYGDETDDWRDQPVILFSVQIENPQTKKVGPAIRIRAPSARDLRKTKSDPISSGKAPAKNDDMNDDIPF